MTILADLERKIIENKFKEHKIFKLEDDFYYREYLSINTNDKDICKNAIEEVGRQRAKEYKEVLDKLNIRNNSTITIIEIDSNKIEICNLDDIKKNYVLDNQHLTDDGILYIVSVMALLSRDKENVKFIYNDFMNYKEALEYIVHRFIED